MHRSPHDCRQSGRHAGMVRNRTRRRHPRNGVVSRGASFDHIIPLTALCHDIAMLVQRARIRFAPDEAFGTALRSFRAPS